MPPIGTSNQLANVLYDPSGLNLAPNNPGSSADGTNGGVLYAGYGAPAYGTAPGTTTTNNNTTNNTAPTTPDYASQAQGLIGQLNSLYNNIYGQIDQALQGQRGSLENNFNNQRQGLSLQYQQTAPQLQNAYLARGTNDSSYAQDAQNLANATYQNNLGAIDNSQQDALAKLGVFGSQQKAQFQGQQDLMNSNPNFYNNIYGISSLGQNLVNAETAASGFGNNSDFINKLNSIAPSQNTGADQLKQQLSSLVSSSVPQFARDQIASGVISNNPNGQDANYWMNYYNNLVNGKATA